MDEYLKRETLLERAEYDNNYRLIVPAEVIKNCPVADVASIVHGRWIGAPLCGNDDCECSECGNWCNIHVNLCGEVTQKYCPYCGAKMDGAK